MADFEKAFRITILGNEGGYDPGTNEHETYMGIDRGANPQWPGWKIIDSIKADQANITIQRMNMLLATNVQLQANIRAFYKSGYWDTFKADDVTDQQLGNNLFDCSVNQGEGLARRFMQVACNEVIEQTPSLGKPLITDHIIGPETLATFNSLPAAQLMEDINSLRLASYKTDKEWPVWGKVWERRLVEYV